MISDSYSWLTHCIITSMTYRKLKETRIHVKVRQILELTIAGLLAAAIVYAGIQA